MTEHESKKGKKKQKALKHKSRKERESIFISNVCRSNVCFEVEGNWKYIWMHHSKCFEEIKKLTCRGDWGEERSCDKEVHYELLKYYSTKNCCYCCCSLHHLKMMKNQKKMKNLKKRRKEKNHIHVHPWEWRSNPQIPIEIEFLCGGFDFQVVVGRIVYMKNSCLLLNTQIHLRQG